MTKSSDKLLATTTQLIDPSKMKQMILSIDTHGQLNAFGDQTTLLQTQDANLHIKVGTIADISLGASQHFALKAITSQDLTNLSTSQKTLRYLPAATDSIISGNEIQDNALIINGQKIRDLRNGLQSPELTIQANSDRQGGKTSYTLTFANTQIGTLFLYQVDNSATTIQLIDANRYATSKTFAHGSSNAMDAIGIYDTQSTMDLPSNESIENSKDALLGVGFTSKFKNISYFAQGKSVGESTMPYGSALLINFGDPLIQRVSESVKVSNTNYDAGAGQSVFTNPDKTIFKSISTDLNHDGLQDIVIAYTDGSIQLLQNYGGKQAAYTNLGEVMRIAVPISDVQVGDTQGDNYPDLIITTSTHQLLVYPNTK